jgi:hypothetical protein
MENTANVGLFAVHRIFSKYADRIYAYNAVHGEDAKRLLAYSPNTTRDIKVRISQ